jgi:hypothetical protein
VNTNSARIDPDILPLNHGQCSAPQFTVARRVKSANKGLGSRKITNNAGKGKNSIFAVNGNTPKTWQSGYCRGLWFALGRGEGQRICKYTGSRRVPVFK